MSDFQAHHPPPAVSKHNLDALTDGIYAVAMTLLVIELKLPDHSTIEDQAQLINAVVHLIPKFISWVISFFVLAIFWFSHQRLFAYVRHVDGKFVWINILSLGLVALLPYSSALSGEYPTMFFSQVFYSLNMMALGALSMWKSRYVHRHPELWGTPLKRGKHPF